MSERLGENIQREWDEDPSGPEVWDALQLFDDRPEQALAALAELAEGGSALAMLYLGCACLSGRGGLEPQPDLGEAWLERSARRGSIEGGFQLACRYDDAGEFAKAEAGLKALAGRGYAPAMFLLGHRHYKGVWGQQDTAQALHWLSMAERAGSLQAGHWLSWIYRHEDLGLARTLAGYGKWLGLVPAWVSHCVRYPTSDRLRLGANARQMAERIKRCSERRGTPA